ADADFYGLEDLSRFLANRINLCRTIYFYSSSGKPVFCNLDAFRAIKPADGIIDRLLAGDRDALAQIVFMSSDTVAINADLSLFRGALRFPNKARDGDPCTPDTVKPGKMFLGSRFTGDEFGSRYEPTPSAN